MQRLRVLSPGRLALVFAFFLPLALSIQPARSAATDPGAVVTDFASRTLTLVHNGQLADAQRRGNFRQLVEQTFDMSAVAQFVAGRYWRTASEAERQKFVNLFTAHMVDIYASRFGNYNNQSLRVTGERAIGDDAWMVASQIIEANAQPSTPIDWRVVKSADGFRIVDVVIGGVSLATTKRDEFGALFQRNGGKMEPVLARLDGMNANNAKN